MKYLIAIATALCLGAMVLMAVAFYQVTRIEVPRQSTVWTTPSTLTVEPNYGEQKTVDGSYLQPATVVLQPAGADLQPANVCLQACGN